MARWVASSISDLPVVSDGESDDPVWYPLQHALGIDAFGANVFVAGRDGQLLVEAHDELRAGSRSSTWLSTVRPCSTWTGRRRDSSAETHLRSPIRQSGVQRGE